MGSCATTRSSGWWRTHLRAQPLVRRQTGFDLDPDGFDTDHITLGSEVPFRNPYPSGRFSDEKIAMSSILTATATVVAGSGRTAAR